METIGTKVEPPNVILKDVAEVAKLLDILDGHLESIWGYPYKEDGTKMGAMEMGMDLEHRCQAIDNIITDLCKLLGLKPRGIQ